MPIQLPKTLQNRAYTLYIITDIALVVGVSEAIHISQRFYESQGHFNDDFLPIIKKDVTIANQQRVNSIKVLLSENYAEALSVAENFLVNNVAYYQGGTVVNGVV